jgi:Ser/Thr protein kinase RdoA (MazF antagonist)
MTSPTHGLPAGLTARLGELYPGAQILDATVLGADEHPEGESAKELGYGKPIRIRLREASGAQRALVFHLAAANDFGHDRRSDRAQNMLLSHDTFGSIPGHVRSVDVGAIRDDGGLTTLVGTGEFYLLTEWVEGTLYADDLRRVGQEGATPRDLARAEVLARYLAQLHRLPGSHPGAYTRAIRDLLGHGEGIFGLVDSYPPDVPGAEPAQLRRVEEACLAWRWSLKDRHDRLRRTHGDFHPFNVVFRGETEPALLDTSRGSEGDPADDVACMAINYLFFALEHRDRFEQGLGALWRRYWSTYLSEAGDSVLDAVAPFFAWRALVLASPLWYPRLTPEDRRRIFRFAERVLAAPRFDPSWGPEALR